jgi:prevent-host-death family protein
MRAGVRDVKNNLSHYLRRLRRGEKVTITAHGRAVAELVPPAAGVGGRLDRYAALVADGLIRPPLDHGDPLEDWPDLRMPPGTAARLIAEDRGED